MNYYDIATSILMLAGFGVWDRKGTLNLVIKFGLLGMGVWGLSQWL
jgi:hypothetical protein